MTEKKLRVLVVDDDRAIRKLFLHFIPLLELENVDMVISEGGEQAVQLVNQNSFDLVFLDVRMPGMGGLEVFRKIHAVSPRAKVVMMTGYAVDDILRQAMQEGAFSAITKPFDISGLLNIFYKARTDDFKPGGQNA